MKRFYFATGTALQWVEATPINDGSGYGRIVNTNVKDTNPVLHESWCQFSIINFEDIKKYEKLRLLRDNESRESASLSRVSRIDELTASNA